MGCGSSKASVAVINTDPMVTNVGNVENFVAKSTSIETKESLDINVSSSSNDCRKVNSKPDVNDFIVEEDALHVNSSDAAISREFSDVGSRTSKQECVYQSKTKVNNSSNTIRSTASRVKSAASIGSNDSGVFDELERNNSGKSRRSGRSEQQMNSERINSGKSACSYSGSISGKPPSGKKSTARKKLLRIDDDSNNDNELLTNGPCSDPLENTILPCNGQNMTLRPKSRFGNLAFDIVLDTPETGNAKKRPEKLVALSTKHNKPKKVKTKRDIDRKMEEVAARRRIQEGEKLLKAKQFQHFSVCTPVEKFQLDEDEEEESTVRSSFSNINDKDTTCLQPLPSNSNDVALKESSRYSSNDEEENETIVQPFHLESDDEDSLPDNTFIGRVTLPAVVAF